MEKIVKIGNKEVKMSATALTPFSYKKMFGEDIIKGMNELQDGKFDSTFIWQVAYVMAKSSDPDIPPIEEWLTQFEMFDMYQAMPQIIEVWGVNEKQKSTPKKK